jgi:hypothetical protein
MREDAGYLVETKTGKEGRTYHREGLINGKMVVHIETEEGKTLKMLCDPDTVKIKGFID